MVNYFIASLPAQSQITPDPKNQLDRGAAVGVWLLQMDIIDYQWKLALRRCSLAVAVALPVFLSFPPTHAARSSFDVSGTKIKNIRQIADVAPSRGGAKVEIELHNAQGFHVGDLNWSLQIGSFQAQRPSRRSADHRSLTYVLALDDWNNLKDGAPVYLLWGHYDAKEKGVRPFARLNKKILKKERTKKD